MSHIFRNSLKINYNCAPDSSTGLFAIGQNY